MKLTLSKCYVYGCLKQFFREIEATCTSLIGYGEGYSLGWQYTVANVFLDGKK